MDKKSPIYKKALHDANRVYGEKSSIYRSSYIVKQYKEYGGKIKSQSPKKKSPKKSKSVGLLRWFDEEWIQVVPYLTHRKVTPCGRSPGSHRRLPACRPLVRITDETPITIPELVKKHGKKSLLKAARRKERSPEKNMSWRTLTLK